VGYQATLIRDQAAIVRYEAWFVPLQYAIVVEQGANVGAEGANEAYKTPFVANQAPDARDKATRVSDSPSHVRHKPAYGSDLTKGPSRGKRPAVGDCPANHYVCIFAHSVARHSGMCQNSTSMKRRIRSLVELGNRLAEARKAAGMTQADLAARARLDRTAITKIESGGRNLDSLELSRIAAILRRPIDWFLVPPPPVVVSRRAALDVATEREADVQLELLARDVEQLTQMDILKLADPVRRPGSAKTLADAERSARAARQALGQPEGPLADLLRIADRLGLVAASISLGDDTLDGSYVALESGGVALINGATTSSRRRFTLAHEIGHHVLADPYSAEWVVSADGEDTERLVNAFAIHFLMPRSSVLERWAALEGRLDPRRGAIHLGAEFGVSWSGVCSQLRNLELVTEEVRRALIAHKPNKAEFLELELSLMDDLRSPSLSPAFAAAVIKSYRKHKLSRERAAEMLRGTVDPTDLPGQDSVPLDRMKAELAPI
jgi:Zn-dependent peptidase ImmA (M78 family)/DNA-binding XRE family transcriptional regulator